MSLVMGSCKMVFIIICLLLGMVEVNGIMVPKPNEIQGYNDLTNNPSAIGDLSSNKEDNGEPSFDTTTPSNITALMGKHAAYLTCRVNNLGNKTVSWIRHRDIHILTVGTYTYTSDQRFQANHQPESNDWTLSIKWPQKRDAGIYECQISTQPVRSHFITLDVIEPLAGDEPARVGPYCRCPVPSAVILGQAEIYLNVGSTINLTCVINSSPEPPAYIFWYHHDDVISYDSARGGVSVITEKGDVTTSILLIQNARLTDNGKYSCSPSNADVASVKVHILNENPAAMQTGAAGLSNSSLNIVILLILFYVYQFTTVYCFENIFIFKR